MLVLVEVTAMDFKMATPSVSLPPPPPQENRIAARTIDNAVILAGLFMVKVLHSCTLHKYIIFFRSCVEHLGGMVVLSL